MPDIRNQVTGELPDRAFVRAGWLIGGVEELSWEVPRLTGRCGSNERFSSDWTEGSVEVLLGQGGSRPKKKNNKITDMKRLCQMRMKEGICNGVFSHAVNSLDKPK